MLLSELITGLQELQETYREQHGFDDVEMLAVHQMNYPLRETVALYAPLMVDHIELLEIEECSGCGSQVTNSDGDLVQAYWDKEIEIYSLCSECQNGKDGMSKDGLPIAYVRLDGQPYDLNPYGPRAAWDES